MKGGELIGRRMHGQRLWGSPFANVEDALRWLTAIQAQEYPFAKWSLAQRAGDVASSEVERAFADGAILRIHILRPTWHFVLPEDIRWMLTASAPRVHALNAHYYRKLDLDAKLLVKASAVLARALESGAHLTRNELAGALERKGIVATGPRLAYIFMHAELEAVVCSGAPRKKQQTYAAFEQRVPRASKTLDREEALAELTRRYFIARGPATLKDYLRWSSLTAAEAKRSLAAVESELERITIDGVAYWSSRSNESAKARTTMKGSRTQAKGPIVDLVQGYDECVMSYFESRPAPHPASRSAVQKNARGDKPGFIHAIFLDGRLVGHWRPSAIKGGVAIETLFYRPLTRPESRALDAAIARYERFLGVPVTRLVE